MEDRNRGNREDRDLVGRFLKRREEKVFRELYRRHAPMLNRFVIRMVGATNGDAEDVIQTTWVRAVENLGRFRWESSLRTWLTGIALNCSREAVRKRSRDESVDWIDAIEGKPSPPRSNVEIRRIDLERAIDRLPRGYREVLLLHDVEGYTHEEIGRLLGIETGTSKSQLSRARRAMRHSLAERA